MPRYNRGSFKELKSFLYNSYVHDAELKNVSCNYNENSMKFELVNPIFAVKIDLTFFDIEIVLKIKGDWLGSRTTICSLTAEENFSRLQKYMLNPGEYANDSLYLMFQMFSGDELHIVSKEVLVEIDG